MGQASADENFAMHLLEWAINYGILQDVLKGSAKHKMFTELEEVIIHYEVAQEQLKAI